MKAIVTLVKENGVQHISCNKGENLRDVLLENKISFYGTLSKHLNCNGRGLCATCGVYILDQEVTPTRWHDKLADRFGYPRLTCQITIEENITIRIPRNKIIWGQLLPYKNKRE